MGDEPEQSGNALGTLGARKAGAQHLTEAVAAYRAALEEYTRARVPFAWAVTQYNLGNALDDLGTRSHNTNELCQALGDHISAWQVFSIPLDRPADRQPTGVPARSL